MKNNSIKKTKAFTLIELLVVISIIGLLSSVVMVSLSAAREKGRIASILKFDTYNYHKLGSEVFAAFDFNESASNVVKDLSGNGYNLTTNDSLESNSPTNVGKSLVLNSGASVSLATGKPFSKSYTLSMWMKSKSTNNSLSHVFSFGDSATQYSLISVTCGYDRQLNISVGLLDGSDTDSSIDTVGPNSNSVLCTDTSRWHNITISYNSSVTASKAIGAYVDGKFIGNLWGINMTVEPDLIQIGGTVNLFNLFMGYSGYNGNIDDVRLYKESLTASEVGKLYAEGLKTHELAQLK